MVLASNEWLNNCEDDQKSATANSTTASTTTATTTTTPNPSDTNAAAETSANTINTSNAALEPSTSSTSTTIVTASNSITTIACQNITKAQLDIMADNLLKETLQSGGDNADLEPDLTINLNNSTGGSVGVPSSNEIVNNNRELLLHASFNSCDTTTDFNSSENSNNILNSNCLTESGNDNSNANSNSNSNTNSNSSTLQSAIVRQTNSAPGANDIGPPAPLSSPITPQALSSALQSVMNATNNANNATAVGNLQNTFLSTLGMDMTASAMALQQTAKQLSSSLCSGLVDVGQTNLAQSANNSNAVAVSSSNMSINIDAIEGECNGQAKIVLICEANSHPFQTRTILLTPNIECKVGRLIAKSKASESNAIFDCKVLSRNHAVLWYSDDGKFWVKDTKSSNGTFINENKLGSEPAELHFGDIVKFGVDVLENSRKEVHGCIIAFVKLYLPDGREAISIGGNTQRSQYSGEGRISFDEMHRLNLYMQEVSQREKALKSKLFNIQNVLDATRKNSALCWQSLIAEDQLLHRIHSLEKKLQIMEKNVPESVLRNEVLKLLEDKNSYQLTAKEALRKVYQERCDAMQMLSKMESAYASSDNECKILRDQIMNSKQSLQDVNARLLRLEADYNEYKEEAERKQQEIKEQQEQRSAELTEKLQQREQECEELRRRVSEFMLQRAEKLDEEEQKQQLQALAKLDAAIADLGFSDDANENDEDVDECDLEEIDMEFLHNYSYGSLKALRKKKKMKLNGKLKDAADSSGSSGGSEKEKSSASPKSNDEPLRENESKAQSKDTKNAKESTIMKWLQNSDLNKKEGSLDIMNAICNDSDSSDENEDDDTSPATDAGVNTTPKSPAASSYFELIPELGNKLKHIQQNILQLEIEIAKELGDNFTPFTGGEEEDYMNTGLPIQNSYMLLKSGVAMLRNTYKEMCANIKQQNQNKQQSKAQEIQQKGSSSAGKQLKTQVTLKPLHEADVNEDDDDSQPFHSAECDESQLTVMDDTNNTATATKVVTANEKLEAQMRAYQEQIAELNAKLQQVESDSHNTLEILQIECDAFKEKVSNLMKLIEQMSTEKGALEQLVKKHKLNESAMVTTPEQVKGKSSEALVEKVMQSQQNSSAEIVCSEPKSIELFEQQMREELTTINSNVVQREEELIVYKERLELTQNDNLQLRHEIENLKLKCDDKTQALMFRPIALGAAVMGIIIYFFIYFF